MDDDFVFPRLRPGLGFGGFSLVVAVSRRKIANVEAGISWGLSRRGGGRRSRFEFAFMEQTGDAQTQCSRLDPSTVSQGRVIRGWRRQVPRLVGRI